jgi:hypothetical protein
MTDTPLPRIRRATVVTTALASIPVLAALAIWRLNGSSAAVSGPEATGGSIITLGLAIAPFYVAVAFPLRAGRLLRHNEFTSRAFRNGQAVLLALVCFLVSLLVVALLGGVNLFSLAEAFSLTVLIFAASALVCFPLVFLWLRLAK